MNSVNSSGRPDRQTRLVQPNGRLSLMFAARSAGQTLNSFQQDSSHLANAHQKPLQGVKMQQYEGATSCLNQAPNANTSGLPTPRHRAMGSVGPPEPASRSSSASTPTPSTVGSALRRRQASLIAPPRANLRLPSPNLTSAPVDQSSFCVRRSQSQRPTGQLSRLASNLAGQPELKNQPNFRPSRDRELEEDGGVKQVISLPPLKSACYIKRLITADREPQSEPIRATKSSPLAQLKPSQLVKPIMTVDTDFVRQKDPTNEAPVSRARFGSAIGSEFAKTRGKGAAEAASTFLPNQSKSGRQSMLPGLAAASKLASQPKESQRRAENGRRLSLQHVGYNSLSLQMSRSQGPGGEQLRSGGESLHRGGQSSGEESAEDVEADGAEDLEDGDGDEDEDDDATTATSITQTSDSNLMLNNTNHELNSMIQMLSSSAILSESNSANGSNLAPSVANYDQNHYGQNERASKFGKTSDYLHSSSSAQLSQVKNRIVKSQSLSFHKQTNARANNESSSVANNLQQPRGSPMSQLSVALQSSFELAQNGKLTRGSDRELDRGAESQGIRLPRPRSRIIFDPTSSQFHISCAQEDEGKLNDSSDSSTDSNEDNSPANERPATERRQQRRQHQQQDEASIKLLRAQDEIMSLRYGRQGKQKVRKPDCEQQDCASSIRRLKECQGSLESLVMNLQPCDQQTRDEGKRDDISLAQNGVEQQNYRRSPVSSALRSFFGIQSGENRESNETKLRPKVATVVRHASLKSTCRPFELEQEGKSSRERKTSLQDERPIKSQPPAKSTNLGSDLLYRAGKKLSASSSSLTSKFKFISAAPSSSQSQANKTTAQPFGGSPRPTDGSRGGYDRGLAAQSCADKTVAGIKLASRIQQVSRSFTPFKRAASLARAKASSAMKPSARGRLTVEAQGNWRAVVAKEKLQILQLGKSMPVGQPILRIIGR